jgi:hypothetical protein
VVHDGQTLRIGISALGVTLAGIAGTLSQSGQFGAVLGTYSDDSGDSGTASVSALNVQVNALAASYSLNSTSNGCQNVGYFAGMRSRP